MPRLQGIITALITPFSGDEVDLEALASLARRQIDAGVHGLLACGTTGETPALSDDEYAAVVKTVVDTASGRVPVLAGTGTNNTPGTVARTLAARRAGADAALVVTPYYNNPQQAGLKRHFTDVAREGGLPVVLYNVPGRTGVNLLARTVVELSRVPNIVGVKEASGSVTQLRDIVAGVEGDFAVLSGDDGLAFPSFAVGARGVISVASNLAPQAMVSMWELFVAGNIEAAAEQDRMLSHLYEALFVETNPVPCKAGAMMLGLCSDAVRPPLAPASATTRDAMRHALEKAGVL